MNSLPVLTNLRWIYFPELAPTLAETPNDQIPCWSWTEAGESWIRCSLADLPAAAGTQEVQVFLPNLHILNTQVKVPRKQQKHLAQILPFLCEDKLACDLEEIHLAAGSIQDETVPVRAIQRSLLDVVLDKLHQQGFEPRGIYSDAEPLLQQGNRVLWLDPRQVLVVDQQRTITLDPSQASYLSALLPEPDDTARSKPELTVYRDAQLDNAAMNLQVEKLRSRGYEIIEVPMQPQTDSSTAGALRPVLMAHGLDLTLQRCVNLLTGPYTPARQKSGAGNWRPLAWVASAMIGLNLLYLLASGVYFEQRADRLLQGSEQLYRQYFPEDRRVVNIRTQTQAHLDRRQQGADEGFFSLLGQLQPGWEEHRSNLQLKSLRYHSQRRELLLDLEGKTIAQLDQFQQALGSKAELLSANEDTSNGARGRIKLQGGH